MCGFEDGLVREDDFSNGPPEQWVIWWAVASDFFAGRFGVKGVAILCRKQLPPEAFDRQKINPTAVPTKKIKYFLLLVSGREKYMKSVLSLHHLDGSFQCGDLGDFVFFAQRELGRSWYLSSCLSYIYSWNPNNPCFGWSLGLVLGG